MWKSLLTAHNIFVLGVLVVLSVGWLVGRLDTSIAIPLITSIGGIGVGASVLSTGLSIGVPLSPSVTAAPAAPPVLQVEAAG